ncbi:MAG: hypothetical protein K0S23_2020 [Fluviicola sp.]|jgi:hypothetical protein|uniref:T9SS type A sorting domain-containing protein n=1 Tax=Fluviicola sp. TaxID=1917219 RepID=UPI00262FE0FC|nr:T9SS type A sorting domain-containing protein [Fluviicola sp.]MDF3027713.1 hypothetical protein [Fluviicola sp.]
MKNLLLSSILLFSSISFSQLMRSEVYDFSVGNYYGVVRKSNAPSSGIQSPIISGYQMFHILTKQLSVTGDSVTYSAQRQSYIPALPNGSGGGTPPSYSIDTFTFIHTDLNTPFSPEIWDHVFGNTATHFWDADTNECYLSLDTLIPSPWCFNNSGQAYHFGMHPDNIDSCDLESLISDYYAYSHAGGPYGGKQRPGDPTEFTILYELFYVVHNGIECGQFPDFFLGLGDYQQLSIEIYPNPVNDKLTIRGVESIQSFLVTTSDGKTVGEVTLENGTVIDVSNLQKGIYFLHLTDFSGRKGTIRFVK